MSAIDDLLTEAAKRGLNTGYEEQTNEMARIVKAYVKALQNEGFSRKEAIKIFIASMKVNARR